MAKFIKIYCISFLIVFTSCSENRIGEKRLSLEKNEVSGIVLTHASGLQNRILKSNDGWIVNDSFPASYDAVSNLLDAVSRVEALSIPPRSAWKFIYEDMEKHKIQVEILDEDNDRLISYLIGGTTSDELGVYGLFEDEDHPVILHIPGWEGNIRHRYDLNINEWRSKYILDFKFDDFKKMSIEYPTQNNHSFIINKSDESFVVEPFTDAFLEGVISNSNIVESYIVGWKGIGIESFITDKYVREFSKTPFCTISIYENDRIQFLKLFPYPDPSPITKRFYGVDHQENVVLIQYNVIKDYLRGLDYFIEE